MRRMIGDPDHPYFHVQKKIVFFIDSARLDIFMYGLQTVYLIHIFESVF